MPATRCGNNYSTLKKRVIIRAEGGPQTGLGHIIRSIALAEMLCAEYDIIFLTNFLTPAIEQMLEGVAGSYARINGFTHAAEEWNNLQPYVQQEDIFVFDGYCFDTSIQQIIKEHGYRLVCIDDIHAYPYLADAVINHSGGFSKNDYQLAPYSTLYSGLEYCLLRKPFREAAREQKHIQPNNQCLICFGGADPDNDTLKTLEQLVPAYPHLQFHVVTGSAYAYNDSLVKYKENTGIRFYSNLDAASLCSLMQQCGMAVTPPSTTAYEYLSVKGILYLKVIASNQEQMFRYLTGERLALPLELFGGNDHLTAVDTAKINSIFDGRQQERLLDIFRRLNR